MIKLNVGLVAIAMVAGAAGGAHADVTDVSPTGFQLQVKAHIAAAADKVYATIVEPAKWWNPGHTWSKNAANLSIDAKAGGCFCEALPGGGSVEHLSVATAMPGKLLRMRGALGPFQGSGLAGSMSWEMTGAGQETDLVVTYDLGGHMVGGFGEWPQKADAMVSEQVARLKKFIETGSP
ncbi:MAG: ATPase [Alphaproteobacteria bacterium]|nr:ATPase [Alphaproteobacteria bacterium]